LAAEEELGDSSTETLAGAEAASVDRAADISGAADSTEIWQTSTAGIEEGFDSADSNEPGLDSGEFTTRQVDSAEVNAEVNAEEAGASELDSTGVASDSTDSNSAEAAVTSTPSSGGGAAAPENDAQTAAYGIAAQPALAAAEEAKAAAATGTPEGQALSDAISQRMYVAAPPEVATSQADESPAAEPGSGQSTDGVAASQTGEGYISVDGTSDDCPAGYPIKGNANSHIYHRPGESSYDVTIPEICFVDEETAVAHGFRPRRSGGAPQPDQQSETETESAGVEIVTATGEPFGASADGAAEGGGAAPEDASSSYGIASSPAQTESASTSGSGRARRAPGAGYVSVDGESRDCPPDYPIKGNESSQIFHRPGESSYDRTIPEICFADDATAVAMGFRERRYGGAQNSQPAEPVSTAPSSDTSATSDERYGIAGADAQASSAATESSDTATSGSNQAGYIEMSGEDRDCPGDYPIKGNASSHIFHQPGESSYDATIPEICFADEAVAVSMGYRPRKH
jgi:hypothetical protein